MVIQLSNLWNPEAVGAEKARFAGDASVEPSCPLLPDPYLVMLSMSKRRPSLLVAPILLVMQLASGASVASGQIRATVSEERRTLPTYAFSEPNPLPILTQDTRLYPYHRFEGYAHEAEPREWTVVTLENPWIEVWVLPEVGGKVWGARVKATGHEFIYRNEVMKFRNIALRGPWTSGGIEFNFGVIGHTPATATPVEYLTRENDDGSVSVFVGAMDLPSRTRWRVEIRLPADRAYFETHAQWQNPTILEHPYYNWMTGAAFAQDDLVLSIPGEAYLEHPGAERRWPVDAAGRLLPVYDENRFGGNKSYHVVGSYQDFFGGYYEDDDYGFGHWGRYEDIPGQKLWLWALSRQGGIWEDLLTDTDGQYVEFQAGRLLVQYSPTGEINPISEVGFEPGASDRWSETWFPVEGLGGLTEASKEGALFVERGQEDVTIRAHAFVKGIDTLRVMVGQDTVLAAATEFEVLEPVSWTVDVSPGKDVTVSLPGLGLRYDTDPAATKLDRPFTTPTEAMPSIPWADRSAEAASELVQGRRLPEARAAYEAVLDVEPWHRDALLGLADLEYRRARYAEGLALVRRALQLDAYDAEANFIAGNLYAAEGDNLNARETYGWASRSTAYRSVAYQQLAALDLRSGRIDDALRYARLALDYDAYALPGLHASAVIARSQGDDRAWTRVLERISDIDPMSHVPTVERWLKDGSSPGGARALQARLRGEYPGQEILELGLTYAAFGRIGDALSVMALAEGTVAEPLARAWRAHAVGDAAALGEDVPVEFVFPFRREMVPVLAWASSVSDHWGWSYLHALVLAARDRIDEAGPVLRSLGDAPDYAPLFTTRALLAGAHAQDREEDLRRAIELDPTERLLRIPLVQQLQRERRWETALEVSGSALDAFPDDFDLALLHVRSLNEVGGYEESLRIMEEIRVLPSEHSSEAQGLFSRAHLMAGLAALDRGDADAAGSHFEAAMTWPERLGQGRPYEPEERLARFLLGLARADAGDGEAAAEAWMAVVEATPPAGFRGGNVTRLDLLGALALERLGRRSVLSDFGNGQEGAMARLVHIVRTGARTDTSVAYALEAASDGMHDVFSDVEGRLLRHAFAASARR